MSHLLPPVFRKDSRPQQHAADSAALLDLAFDPVIVKELDSGRIRYWNTAAERLYGWRSAEALGQVVHELLATEFPESLESIHAVLERDGVWEGEIRHTARDGRHILVAARWALQPATGHETTLVLEVNSDITQRRRTEQQLHFQAHLLQSVGQAVIATSVDGKVVYWNHAAEELYGWTAEEAMGRRAGELLVPLVSREQGESIMEALARGERWRGEYTVQRRDGTVFPVLVTDTPIYDHAGNLTGIIGVSADISERVEGERARAHLAAIVEWSDDAIFSTTPEGVITTWNPGAERLFGHTAVEAVGQHVTLIAPPERHVEVDQILARLNRGEHVGAHETVRVGKDGRHLPVSISGSTIRDARGVVVGLSAIVRDISDRKRAEEALRESEERYRLLVETSPYAIVVADMTARLTFANRRAAQMHGYDDPSEMIGRSGFDLVAPVDRDLSAANMAAAVAAGRGGGVVHQVLRRDGSTFPVEVTGSVIRNEAGEPVAVMTIAQDVTERIEAEKALCAANQRAQTILESITDAFITLDSSWRFSYVNARAEALMRHSKAELLGKNIWEIGPSVRGSAFEEEFRRAAETGRPVAFEEYQRHLGAWFEVHAYPSEEGLSVYFRDVSQRRAYEEQLQHQALHDALTDLPNRTLFEDRVQQALLAARRDQEPLALLLVDLDRFKEVNDALGHQAGDAFLQQIAHRFRALLRDADTMARFGGDEFVILLPTTDAAGAVRVASKLLQSLEAPFYVEGRVLYGACSIGIVTAPVHGSDVTTLLRRADMTMYEAKRLGAGYALYKEGADQEGSKRLDLITDLRAALEAGDLLLHYQPKLDLATGRAAYAEALVRWKHPTHGMIPPGQFIGLAEQMGLIKPLTAWVINEGVRQAGEWHAAGREVQVAINLSTWNLHDDQLVDTVRQALHRWGVAPAALLLEITESALMADPPRALETVTHLHELGVAISIDDFGTGYSSLAYLQRLPVDELKIDREFVMEMNAADAGPAIIVRSVIDLGHTLGLRVVAEGVETEEQLRILTMLGCDQAQGYHLCRPVPAPALATWKEEWDAAHADLDELRNSA